jgi:hypothetical protein
MIGPWLLESSGLPQMQVSSLEQLGRRTSCPTLARRVLTTRQMFSIASKFAAGTVGRQLAWIFLGGLAVITLAVGLSQPEMEEADPVLKQATLQSVDEETSLLRNDGEAAE